MRHFNYFLLCAMICFLFRCASAGSNANSDANISKAILSGGLMEMEEELLDNDLNGKESQQGLSFLHIAAKTGNLKIVQDIAGTNININVQDNMGNTPLHYAIINGRADIAAFLIDRGADINIKNKNGQTPVHLAALSIPSINKYIPSIIPVNGNITSEFGIRHNPFTGKYQFHGGLDIGAPVGTPVRAVADGTVIKHGWYGGLGNVIIIKHEYGFLTIYGHCKEVKVRKGTKVHQGEIVALVGQTGVATGYHCHFEIRNNSFAVSPLPYLHLNKEEKSSQISDTVTLLYDRKAQFNLADNSGRTALHYASVRSSAATGLFLSKGPELNAQDYFGFTPLHYAAMTDVATVRELLKAGIRVNVRSKKTYTGTDGMYYSSGTTALGIAMKKESLEMVKLLIRNGAVE